MKIQRMYGNMTERWSDIEKMKKWKMKKMKNWKDEKIKRLKDEIMKSWTQDNDNKKIKSWQMSTYKPIYIFKQYAKMKRWWKDEKDEKENKKITKWGQKEDKKTNKKMMEWWKDDAWLKIDDCNRSLTMYSPMCDIATMVIGWWSVNGGIDNDLPTVQYHICNHTTIQH